RYNRRILMALGITAALAVAAMAGTFLAKQFKSKDSDKAIVRDVVIQNVQEKEPPPPPPPPPPKTPPPPKVEMAKFTPPVIKKDEEVKKEEIPPVEKLQDTKIDVVNQEGVKDENIATPPVVDEGKQVVEAPKEEDENKVFEKVEIEASVNTQQWRRWLEGQLQ